MKDGPVQDFLDFDVAIEPLDDGFRARVVASPVGEAYADFTLPFTEESLTILVLRVIGSISRARRRVRRIQSEERRLLEDFGGQLFQAVFSGRVGECLRRSHLLADSRDAGLRVRLRLPGALANIPWEYLYDAEGLQFLGLSPEIALVRYVEMAAPVRALPISPPLRVLAMIPAPSDVPDLEAEREWGTLTEALAGLVDRGLVEVHRMEAGTLAALQRPLRLREYHVLHFIGHGVYDEEAQDGALALEGTNGKSRLVTGRDLGLMIRGHRSLRLVVLNACEGARSARDDPFGGVAQALVRQGIPAVIAMQFEISDLAALVFSQSFYQAIADGLPVDVAMVEARRAMFAEGNEVEWATPVLYLRSPDGRVFIKGQTTVADRGARIEAEHKTGEKADLQVKKNTDRKSLEQVGGRANEDIDDEFDPTLYGMPATYDEQGNYQYPEGFDAEAGEWLPGYETQRDEFERQYAKARAKYEAHWRQVLESLRADKSTIDDEFDPTLYGMPATYDEQGNYQYPEGFDAEAGEWLPGYETQRDEWERQYAKARAKYEAHQREAEESHKADKENVRRSTSAS